jgi:hypothetical protein
MRNGISPLLAVLFTAAVTVASATGAELSPEALQSFQWLSDLGYPDIKDAPWVEVRETRAAAPKDSAEVGNRRFGFIVGEADDEVRILQPNLVEETYRKGVTNHLGYLPPDFRRMSFNESAQELLAEVPEHVDEFGHQELDKKAQAFFYAYAAWRRGEMDLAESLFERAVQLDPDMSSFHANPLAMFLKIPPPPVMEELERELSDAAYQDAFLQFSGMRFEATPERSTLPPRAVILEALRQALRRFPKDAGAKQAGAVASILEKMVEEDRRHHAANAEDLAKRSVDEQVAEWIFQLRDQTGQIDPYSPDNYALNPVNPELPDPARELVKIGTPAVPQLLAALDDERLSRCLRVTPMMPREREWNILTVGKCAEMILGMIAGRHFTTIPPNPSATRPAIASWWTEVQTKGEKQTLIDALSGGQLNPSPLVARLAETYPDAVEGALIAGALRAKDIAHFSNYYITELANRNSPQTTDALLAILDNRGHNPWLRLPAARVLIARGNPAALPAVKRIWQSIPVDPPKGRLWNGLYGMYFDTSLAVLLASGEMDSVQTVVQSWDRRWPSERFEIIRQIAILLRRSDRIDDRQHNTGSGLEKKPVEKAAAALSAALLVHALTDKTVSIQNAQEFWNLKDGSSTFVNQPNPTTAAAANRRNCDLALKYLHELQPEIYAYSQKATLEECDRQCVEAIKQWLKTQSAEGNPIAGIDLEKLFSGKE